MNEDDGARWGRLLAAAVAVTVHLIASRIAFTRPAVEQVASVPAERAPEAVRFLPMAPPPPPPVAAPPAPRAPAAPPRPGAVRVAPAALPMPTAAEAAAQSPPIDVAEPGIGDAIEAAAVADPVSAATAPVNQEPYDPASRDIVAPVATARTAPRYPSRARREGLTGRVILRGVVTVDGKLRDVSILAAEPGGEGFEEAALAAAAKWRFAPATRRGERVEVYWRLTFEFRLE